MQTTTGGTVTTGTTPLAETMPGGHNVQLHMRGGDLVTLCEALERLAELEPTSAWTSAELVDTFQAGIRAVAKTLR